MTVFPRLPKMWLALPLLLVVVIAIPLLNRDGEQDTLPPSLAQQAALAVPTNRIAFVGSDGNIFTITPEGTDLALITFDGSPTLAASNDGTGVQEATVYSWPTWSPDSRWLAYSRVHVESPGGGLVELITYERATAGRVRIYSDQASSPPVMGAGIPHYIQWSPDSQLLTFLANTTQGLRLFRSSPDQEDVRPTDLGFGAPLYFDWSPTSQALAIHHQSQHYLMDREGGLVVDGILAQAGSYRAPAWSSTGQHIAIVTTIQGQEVVAILDHTGGVVRVLKAVEDGAVLWSPVEEEKLALSQSATLGTPTQGLTLFNVETGEEQALTGEPVYAFFWSPDGQRIVYLTSSSETFPTWKAIKLGQPAEITPIIEMLPSQELLAGLLYFDQYAHSYRVWSPDSRYLVLSGYQPGQQLGDPSQVVVVDSEGVEPPRVIAEGTLAFWSPS